MKDSKMKRLLFIIPLLVWAASAGAVNTSDIVELSCLINIGVDSGNYAIDSVVFRSRHHRTLAGRWTWLGKGSKCVIHTTDSNLAGSVFTDSLCWTVSVPIDSFESVNLAFDYMPTIAAWVYWDSASGRGISREDIDISPVLRSIYSADSVTAQLPDSVTVNVNYDSIRAAVALAMVGGGSEAVQITAWDTSCHCPGARVVNNMDVTVRSWDFGTVEAWGPTNANGIITFALDTGLHWISGSSSMYLNGHTGYYAPDWDSLYVTGPMTQLLPMYTYAASIPPPAGTTPVTFNFREGGPDSGQVRRVELQYKLSTKAQRVYHMDSTVTIDYSIIYSAFSNSSGNVTAYVIPNDSLLVEGGKTGQTQWWFQAFNPETGQPYLGKDGLLLTVPASSSELVWPDDF